MRRKLFLTAISFALTAVVAIAVVTFMPSDASAYSEFVGAGNCEQCHTAGFSGPGDPLHDLHVPMSPDCNACHPSGAGSKPVLIKSSGPLAAGGNGVGCNGCHDGPGLREHHRITNAATCAGCHASPESPPGENILPPYYNTATVNGVNDPCNPTAAANTNENWDGNFMGLDNDGDGVYDGNDTDCGGAPPAATATYNPKTGDFTSTETKVGGKAFNIKLNQTAGPGYNFSLGPFSSVAPSGSPSCTFTGATGVLECPVVTVTGSKTTYHVTMDQTTGYNFKLRSAPKNR